MTDTGPDLHIEWLPDFGCALLPLVPLSDATLQPGYVKLYLVAPDGWNFSMHRWDHRSAISYLLVHVQLELPGSRALTLTA